MYKLDRGRFKRINEEADRNNIWFSVNSVLFFVPSVVKTTTEAAEIFTKKHGVGCYANIILCLFYQFSFEDNLWGAVTPLYTDTLAFLCCRYYQYPQ
jgi:hypothetical protein